MRRFRLALLSFLALVPLLSAPLAAHVRITTDITFSDDVRPLLRRYCMGCHSPGGSAPDYVDLTTYGTDRAPGARAWATAIEEEVMTGRMPPWQADPRFDEFGNSRRLRQDEIETLAGWIQGGAPQGPRRDLPTPPEFEKGAWQLGEPDLIVEPPQAVVLPPKKVEATVAFDIPLDVEEDTWVTGFEFRPGDPGTVYRMAAWILDPDGAEPESLEVEIQVPYDPFRDEDEPEPTRQYRMPPGPHFLGQWLRGDAPVLLPAGMGRRLRKGSSLLLRIEYRRREMDGYDSEIEDLSRLGLFLAQEPHEVDLILLSKIATADEAEGDGGKKKRRAQRKSPGSADLEAVLHFDEDVRLVSMFPNFGPDLDDVEVTLHYPDGQSDVLLLIEDYDPAWPASFLLEEPRQTPAGSWIEMQGTLDGTADREAQAFELEVAYAVNDHLVLPEIIEPSRQPQSRGGMMLLGDVTGLPDLASKGAPVPEPTDPRAAAHMDHSPLHGGQFFMAANNYHHLEGALPEQGEFRLYVYDDFKEPIDPRNFAGDVVFEQWNEQEEKWMESRYPLQHAEPGAEYLYAEIPPELPAEFFASVWLAGEPVRFDFYFDELSEELSATELAKYQALGPHSHERPPLDIPESAEEIVAELVERTQILRELVLNEDWLALHIPAFDARDLAMALLDQLGGLSARERGAVRQAASRTMQSAAELDRAGDLADAGRARRAFARYEEAVRTIIEAF